MRDDADRLVSDLGHEHVRPELVDEPLERPEVADGAADRPLLRLAGVHAIGVVDVADVRDRVGRLDPAHLRLEVGRLVHRIEQAARLEPALAQQPGRLRARR